MSRLIIDGVSKSFGGVQALKDINLTFESGELVTFLGPSGCGKTTLLRIIAGLEEATSGKILLNGDDITRQAIHKRDVGMVFQSFALFPHLSVSQNIAYGLRLRGSSRPDREKRVRELLDLVRLPGIEDRRIDQLSGGQRQRVAIARALALRPKLFLLDEPMSALDANLRDEMQIELRQLQQRLGITTIVVTHDQTEAMTISDRIVVLGDQTIQQSGKPIEIYKSPVNRFVANFIGTSNLIPARLTGDLQAIIGDSQIALSGKPLHLAVGDDIFVLTRPEDVSVFPGEADRAPNTLDGVVTFVRDIGMLIEILVECRGQKIIAVMTPKDAPDVNVGDRVAVRLPASACLALER
jgi:putative spermidine/putrescine transport system ATP-binding protein